MYSVGIDVSKGKSTVCIIDLDGVVLVKPFEIRHVKDDFERLEDILKKLGRKKDIKVVMEATGIYHWPVFKYLKDKDYFVAVINPLQMKSFAKNQNFRLVKTDKIDSGVISLYGTEKWRWLINSEYCRDDKREHLRRLSRAYDSYQKPKVNIKQILDLELEKTMPGIKDILQNDDKLCAFVLEFRHFDKIKRMSEEKFLEKFREWKKKKGYRFHRDTPTKIYQLAIQATPSVPYDAVCRLTLESSIETLKAINKVLGDILTQAMAIAEEMPEYNVVRSMPGVGDVLSTQLIAEIGDIRILNDKKSLVCMAGIDVPPYESGKFVAKERKITKKGNSHLRRTLFLVMTSLIKIKPTDDNAVYEFIQKKRTEGKAYKKSLVAGMRKFLHIYYARVKETYINQGIWNISD